MKKYQPVIGLEIHVELKTQSKMFCQCSANYFGKKPNTNLCPVCLGLPGALPVPNKKAVLWTILLGKALNCSINKISKFDRKHYFYPDLPKGYQISQYDQPIAYNGWFEILDENLQLIQKVGITRVHLEEDTGKLIHQKDQTLIDFNRSGVPLVEIVTEPDFNDSQLVKQFLEELQVLIRYLGISDADMEKGSMRLEPNISVKKQGYNNHLPDYKVELKNINSFRFVKQAIDYEVKRQISLLEKGEKPIQETRGFDSKKGITFSQRKKEQAHDYRYFPEPDIPPMVFSQALLNEINKQIPELPHQKLTRFIKKLGLRYHEAYILIQKQNLADFFEKVIEKAREIKPAIIANLIVNKKISVDQPLSEFINKLNLYLKPKKIDEKKIDLVVKEVLEENKKAVADYLKGKENVIMFLVGQAMKKLKGQGEPKIIKEKLVDFLKK